MAGSRDLNRYLSNLKNERNSAALYRAIAEYEMNPKISEVYRKLAEAEDAHARTWEKIILDAGAAPPLFRPSLRTRALVWMVRRFGIEMVLPKLSADEVRGSGDYRAQPEAADMIPAEQSHARLLRQIEQTSRGGMEGPLLARLEGRHRSAGGNALRAAVLGASDGLVSNFTLVMGVSGAELSGGNILLTGFAGLLAGSLSMALGEWISVQSSRELYQKQINTEKDEIANAPEEEFEELVLIYQARGLDETTARRMAVGVMSTPETAIETLARDELGINPEELGGSAWEAAVTSFLLFAAGAVVPVVPFLLFAGTTAVIVSAAFSCLGLFAIGAAITLFTGRPVFSSGMRQVFFGLAAAAGVFLIGRLIGVALTG